MHISDDTVFSVVGVAVLLGWWAYRMFKSYKDPNGSGGNEGGVFFESDVGGDGGGDGGGGDGGGGD